MVKLSNVVPVEKLPPVRSLSPSSWILRLPKLIPTLDRKLFHGFFKSHPPERRPIMMFGKQVYENRWSQMYSINTAGDGDDDSSSYTYSGFARSCKVCDPAIPEEQFILELCHAADILIHQLIEENVMEAPKGWEDIPYKDEVEDHDDGDSDGKTRRCKSLYNCCLVNWYKPEHTIGLHADDEKEMDNDYPILSLSWGGPRRFLLRPKPKSVGSAVDKVTDILLKDGDVVIMGGKCQDEFKHEIPKVRKMDGLVGDRISWTIRRMKLNNQERSGNENKRRRVDTSNPT